MSAVDSSATASPEAPPAQTGTGLPRPVWLLGWVSLFTDAATEAVYPLLPFFLTRVLGAGIVSLGIIEGAAEAANSLLKVASGYWSDRIHVKKPVVVAGYALSSVVRPFIGLVGNWPQLLLIRFVDRIGKGIRGAPRDAMLASWARPEIRGRVFGFHRAMDNSGAVLGPVLAGLFLLAVPGAYRTLFGLTIIPGAIAVAILVALPESPRAAAPPAAAPPPGLSVAAIRRAMPRDLKVFLLILALLTLGNSTDAFLLLRLTDVEGSPLYVLLFWALFNLVKAALSTYGGALSDRVDRRWVIGGGWFLYAVVYLGFARSVTTSALTGWFLLYGVYYAFTEGAERALIADLAPADLRGTVFGLYNAVLGIGALVASVVFGLIWTLVGAPVAFTLGAVLALISSGLLVTVRMPRASVATRYN